MQKIYDIRDQIPRFAANFFKPADPSVRYPKMMINKETGKPYLDHMKRGIVVNSEEEETAFWADKGEVPAVEAPKAVEVAVEEPIRRGPGRPPLPKNLTA
jgi:hypothetical protein